MNRVAVLTGAAVVLFFLWSGSEVRADDAAALAEAEAWTARMRQLRLKKQYAELPELLAGAAGVHNALQDPKVRRRLQSQIASVLHWEAGGQAHDAAVQALLALDDVGAGWRRLKRHLPGKEAQALSDLNKCVLAALAASPHEAAVSSLKRLASKAEAPAVRGVVIEVLGAYRFSPQRTAIASFLVGELARRKPKANASLSGSWVEPWKQRSSALIAALCRLTGQSMERVAPWVSEKASAPEELVALFDGRRTLVVAGARAGTPWSRMRAALGRPKGRVGQAVEQGLRWLAAHQSPSGGWEAAGFQEWYDGQKISDANKRTDGLGRALFDPGVTGLALYAFLSAGYTDSGTHAFAGVVSRGLRYLTSIQDSEGCFGPRSATKYLYNHALATLAMVEAYGITGSPPFKGPAQHGLDFIALARNPYSAWRYGIKPGKNDTSITAFMTLTIGCAHMLAAASLRELEPAPLEIGPGQFAGVKALLEKVTDPDYGRVGYLERGVGPNRKSDSSSATGFSRPPLYFENFPGAKSEAPTAAGMYMRMMMGEEPRKSHILKLGADLCAHLPPKWNAVDGSIDMIYWFFGSLAMHGMGGKYWRGWRKNSEAALLNNQHASGTVEKDRGSWDPLGVWGRDGGRVYATAISVLNLLTPHRYPAFSR